MKPPQPPPPQQQSHAMVVSQSQVFNNQALAAANPNNISLKAWFTLSDPKHIDKYTPFTIDHVPQQVLKSKQNQQQMMYTTYPLFSNAVLFNADVLRTMSYVDVVETFFVNSAFRRFVDQKCSKMSGLSEKDRTVANIEIFLLFMFPSKFAKSVTYTMSTRHKRKKTITAFRKRPLNIYSTIFYENTTYLIYSIKIINDSSKIFKLRQFQDHVMQFMDFYNVTFHTTDSGATKIEKDNLDIFIFNAFYHDAVKKGRRISQALKDWFMQIHTNHQTRTDEKDAVFFITNLEEYSTDSLRPVIQECINNFTTALSTSQTESAFKNALTKMFEMLKLSATRGGGGGGGGGGGMFMGPSGMPFPPGAPGMPFPPGAPGAVVGGGLTEMASKLVIDFLNLNMFEVNRRKLMQDVKAAIADFTTGNVVKQMCKKDWRGDNGTLSSVCKMATELIMKIHEFRFYELSSHVKLMDHFNDLFEETFVKPHPPKTYEREVVATRLLNRIPNEIYLQQSVTAEQLIQQQGSTPSKQQQQQHQSNGIEVFLEIDVIELMQNIVDENYLKSGKFKCNLNKNELFQLEPWSPNRASKRVFLVVDNPPPSPQQQQLTGGRSKYSNKKKKRRRKKWTTRRRLY